MDRLKKDNKKHQLNIRVSQEQKNFLKSKALLYTEGNVSEYLIYAALNFVPSKEDFEENGK